MSADNGDKCADTGVREDSFGRMMAAVQAFHDKHRFQERGGEDMVYRLALMTEELGEIADCVTKGRPREHLAEECADLLILLLGNAIAADFDLSDAFWKKMEEVNGRGERIVDGRVRVTAYSDG
jgi:NTP pyrophosphatase (non-canonical NTP hydrolase)